MNPEINHPFLIRKLTVLYMFVITDAALSLTVKPSVLVLSPKGEVVEYLLITGAMPGSRMSCNFTLNEGEILHQVLWKVKSYNNSQTGYYTWDKIQNKQEAEGILRLHVKQPRSDGDLEILNATYSHYGLYTCIVKTNTSTLESDPKEVVFLDAINPSKVTTEITKCGSNHTYRSSTIFPVPAVVVEVYSPSVPGYLESKEGIFVSFPNGSAIFKTDFFLQNVSGVPKDLHIRGSVQIKKKTGGSIPFTSFGIIPFLRPLCPFPQLTAQQALEVKGDPCKNGIGTNVKIIITCNNGLNPSRKVTSIESICKDDGTLSPFVDTNTLQCTKKAEVPTPSSGDVTRPSIIVAMLLASISIL